MTALSKGQFRVINRCLVPIPNIPIKKSTKKRGSIPPRNATKASRPAVLDTTATWSQTPAMRERVAPAPEGGVAADDGMPVSRHSVTGRDGKLRHGLVQPESRPSLVAALKPTGGAVPQHKLGLVHGVLVPTCENMFVTPHLLFSRASTARFCLAGLSRAQRICCDPAGGECSSFCASQPWPVPFGVTALSVNI